MKTDWLSTMLLFLIIFFVFFVVIFLFMKLKGDGKEGFYQFLGRNPDGKFACCGNIDWYLGEQQYQKDCPGSVPPAFQDARDYYTSIQENF